MELEEFFKMIIPIINLIGTIVFIKNRKLNKKVTFVIILFYGLFNLSANFSLIYRYLYQFIIFAFSLYSLRLIILRRKTFLFHYFFFFFLVSVLLSYFINSGFNSSIANTSLINYILVMTSSIGVCTIFIQEKNILLHLSDYLRKLLFYNSILIILIFIYSGFGYRVEYTFSNTNYLAFFLGASMIFIHMISLSDIKDNVTPMLLLAAIFCTGSRSILFIALPFYFFLYLRKKPWLFILLTIIAIPLVINFTEKLGEMARVKDIAEDASILQRYEIFLVVKNIFEAKPLFGIGYGRFIEEFKYYLDGDIVLLHAIDEIVTHNDYYRVLAELGLFGMFLFLFYIFKNAFYLLRIKYDFAVLFLFILAVSYSFTHNNLNSFLFWLMVSMPYIYYQRKKYKI